MRSQGFMPKWYSDHSEFSERTVVGRTVGGKSMMARLANIFLATVMCINSVEAETYLCIADKATGFSFNKAKKTWETTQFDVSEDKYLLTQKDDQWSWTKVGEKYGAVCDKGFTSAGYFRCDYFEIIYMNRNNLRFQKTYPYGYPNDADTEKEGASTPSVEIGRCSAM